MAEVVLFHHALGRTPGFLTFADALAAAGHTVHTPDLYDGRTFTDLTEGVAHAEQDLGMEEVIQRGRRAAEELPESVVYAGFSLGTLPAQALAQTSPGAKGALLFHGGLPASMFGTAWPDNVPVQVHSMDRDEWAELDEARELVGSAQQGELFLYPGDGHLFADPTVPDFDEHAASLLRDRVLAFLESVDR
jgi:dienelactone hydrolase